MGNDGTYADGNLNAAPGGTAIKLNKDVEFKVIFLEIPHYFPYQCSNSFLFFKYQITKILHLYDR